MNGIDHFRRQGTCFQSHYGTINVPGFPYSDDCRGNAGMGNCVSQRDIDEVIALAAYHIAQPATVYRPGNATRQDAHQEKQHEISRLWTENPL